MGWRIPAVILIVLVGTARGESLAKKPQLGVMYFVLGMAFLVVGAFMLIPR